MAQTVNNEIRDSGLYYGVQQLKEVAGAVYDPKGDPVPHAQVAITNNAGAAPQFAYTDQSGRFQTAYQFLTVTDEVRHFSVHLTVTKKGFQTAHRRSEISADHLVGIPITLRPVQAENPALLPQADVIKVVAPRLRLLSATDGLGAKDEKMYARAVQEFLDRNHLEQAVEHFDEVVKDSPQCLRCYTMLGLAELSWADWDDAQHDLAEPVNRYIASKTLGSFEPLFVVGELSMEQGEPEKASLYLAEAVKFAPKDALGLAELGRAQSLDMQWAAASETLKKAIAAGAGPESQLMLAEALTWAGTSDEADAALSAYLNGREPQTMPPRVKNLWLEIQAKRKGEDAFTEAAAKAKSRGIEQVDYINHPPISNLADFEPATDQAQLVPVLDAVGKNVAQLFANIPNVCSTESVRQERLTRKGKTALEQHFNYRYLMTSQEQHWGPMVEEHRANLSGQETSQVGASDNYMLTSGFVSAPLVFHTAFQAGSTFRLLGVQKLRGRRAYLVAYAQVPGKTRIYGSFKLGNTESVTYSQGMAWVDAENYQIVRLVTDLLRPAPLMRLEKVNTEIQFSEVQFKKQGKNFWLPDDVTVSLDWNGCKLRNRHSYSEFLISDVDSTEKIKAPKNAAKTSAAADLPVSSFGNTSSSIAEHQPAP